MRSGGRARAASVAGAILGLSSGAPAEPIAPRSTRQFVLVEERFDASKLQHARVTRTFVTRDDRRSSTNIGLSAGFRDMGLSDLGRELQSNGYSPIGTRPTFGVGAGLFGSHVFAALTFEGAAQSLRNVYGVDATFGYFDFLLQAGPVFTVQQVALFYPYAGIGVSQTSIHADTANPGTLPFLRGSLVSLPKGFDVFSTFGSLELGVGSLVSLPLVDSPADRYGIGVGTELGYSFPFAESKWRDSTEGPNPSSYAGPSGGVHGPTVRLLLRYVYDGFNATHEERVLASCEGSGCRVVCDAGFADCDGDTGNGCETEMGTLEDCGGCGDACTIRHGIGVCSAAVRHREVVDRGDVLVEAPHSPHPAGDYQCVVAACEPGFMNCNGWGSDGCETFVANDPYNCGVCGHLCTPLERCLAGRCAAKGDVDAIP